VTDAEIEAEAARLRTTTPTEHVTGEAALDDWTAALVETMTELDAAKSTIEGRDRDGP
jgi:hypothetical protein